MINMARRDLSATVVVEETVTQQRIFSQRFSVVAAVHEDQVHRRERIYNTLSKLPWMIFTTERLFDWLSIVINFVLNVTAVAGR